MSSYPKLRTWLLLVDLLWLIVSVILACFLRYGLAWRSEPRSTLESFVLMLLGSWVVWPALSRFADLGGGRQGWRVPAITSHLLLMLAVMLFVLLTTAYLTRIYFSRLAIAYFAGASFLGFLAIRLTVRAVLKTSKYSDAARKICIVGSGPIARETAARFAQHPEMRCRVIGFLTPDDTSLEALSDARTSTSTYLPASGVLDALRTQEVDEVVFANSGNGDPRVAELMEQCVKRGVNISIIPQPYELYLSAVELVDLDGIPVVRLRRSLSSPKLRKWKRVMDLVLAFPLLLVALPIILGAGLILRFKKGAAFCREERYGLQGQRFWFYRLNSPRKDTDLPKYERMLQYLSITELPQLLNVMRGEMSLVGPRPEGIDRIRHYTDWHWQRLSVKPGITGLAQVHGLRDQHALEDKTRYDLQYILHRSLFQDLSLLLQTIWTLIVRLGHLHGFTRYSPNSLENNRAASKSAVA
jgi:lipopolysaccharide/colanic/teichoic acid biosynthesis glycosyltransferase